jgi:hypothetical protein
MSDSGEGAGKPVIHVMLSYARSGGTLLNKCISSADNTLVLSEVSPVLSAQGASLDDRLEKLTPFWQMKEWYEVDISKEASFLGQVKEIYDFCQIKDKVLIIRDWSYISFNRDDKLKGHEPSYSFDIIKELEQHFEVLVFGLVRNAVDVWLSMGRPPVGIFFSSYFSFINHLDSLGVYTLRFEDLTADPEVATTGLFEYLNIPYKVNLNSIDLEERITGDVSVKDSFRGESKKTIKVMTRKPLLPWEYIVFVASKNKFDEINKINNYSTDYFNEKYTISNYLSGLVRKLRGKLSI